MSESKSSCRTLVVMGVSGCGKSLIGSMLAFSLGCTFEDADDFHPPANKEKMSARIPLTDEDRWPWLQALRARILEVRAQAPCYVQACSALKRVYRDILRGDDTRSELLFVFLRGSKELISARLAARKGHFMPASLLDSQFATLEEPGPDEAIIADIAGTPEEIVAGVLHALADGGSAGA